MSRIHDAMRRAAEQADGAGAGTSAEPSDVFAEEIDDITELSRELFPIEMSEHRRHRVPAASEVTPAASPAPMVSPAPAVAAMTTAPAAAAPAAAVSAAVTTAVTTPVSAPAVQTATASEVASPAPSTTKPARTSKPFDIKHVDSRYKGKTLLGDEITAASREQYRRLAATLHHAQAARGTKVVMVTSATVGEGKTLTCSNLAVTLSE